MINKPYSESCVQNQESILAVIRPLLADSQTVLEVGSGTGQHAVYFASELSHLIWQSSDCPAYLPGIRSWLDEAGLANTPDPLELDVTKPWPQLSADTVFSANTVHIMHWPMVEALFTGLGSLLPAGGQFLLYGPFNYNGSYSSDSNARFDIWLKARDPDSGIKDFETLDRLAQAAGLNFIKLYSLPANNQILHWQKI